MNNVKGKTLLILGAGFGQVPAIEKAIELGLNTIVVDKNPNAIGMNLVENSFPIDVIDKTALLSLAKEYNIDGVVTMQTDLPIPTIGFLNDELGLTGVSYQCSLDCSHKTQTRLKLKEKEVSQPLFEIVRSYNEAIKSAEIIGYPVVVKAIDSSGSRGVTKVENKGAIKNAFYEALKHSRQKDVLVEEFIDGVEIGAQAFSIQGKCVKVLLHNDTLASGDFMVPKGHSFPSFMKRSQLDYAEKAIIDCVEALEIKDGPSNIDIIFNKKDGVAKIIEVGSRIGATCLPELVKYYSGIDWVEATILNALGEQVELIQKKSTPTAALIIEAPTDGVLQGYDIPQSVSSHKDVLELEITAKKGERVSILRKGTDRIGKIIVKGKSYTDAENLAKDLASQITFRIETIK